MTANALPADKDQNKFESMSWRKLANKVPSMLKIEGIIRAKNHLIFNINPFHEIIVFLKIQFNPKYNNFSKNKKGPTLSAGP